MATVADVDVSVRSHCCATFCVFREEGADACDARDAYGADPQEPKPRVTAGQMRNMPGGTVVLLVGKRVQMTEEMMRLRTCDGGEVDVSLSGAGNAKYDALVMEFEAEVLAPGQARERSHVDFNDDFGAHLLTTFTCSFASDSLEQIASPSMCGLYRMQI